MALRPGARHAAAGRPGRQQLLLEDRIFDAELARTIGFATDVMPEPAWPKAIATASAANPLDRGSAAAPLSLTVARHGEADMAALVESASRP